MSSYSNDHSTILKERHVLQALCVGDSNSQKTAGNLLSGYRWREPIHQIIFSCLMGFSAAGHATLREQLAECATRKGFPDVEWEDFFTLQPISTQEVEALMKQLSESYQEGKQRY